MSLVPELTIVIPTFNREDVLLNSIRDCLEQVGATIEVMVVDQSLEHSKKFQADLKKLMKDPRLTYYRAGPASVTAAKNFALEHTSTKLAIFIDDDVQIPKGFAKNHLDSHSKHPDVSAIGGRVLQEGFPILDEILHFDEYAVSRGVFTSPKSGYTNAFAGGNVSIKVKDALAVGGFDTRYYLNAFREESDMSIKMVRAGQKIFYEPKACLTHLAAPRGGSRDKTYTSILDTHMFYRNELFFTLRAARSGSKISALQRKYHEYCGVPSRKLKAKRTIYFALGVVAAQWRRMFGRQRTVKEFI